MALTFFQLSKQHCVKICDVTLLTLGMHILSHDDVGCKYLTSGHVHLKMTVCKRHNILAFLAHLDKVQEELLYYPWHWHWCRRRHYNKMFKFLR